MFALLLAAGLSGCVKERYEGPGGDTKRPVVFSPQVTRSAGTRAADKHPIENISGQTDAALIPDGKTFGVYAWAKETATATVGNFADLQNMSIQRDGAQYKYTPVANWPQDDAARLSFFAYYPHSASTDAGGCITATRGTDDAQWMKVAYTVPVNSGEHIDLMYAKTAMMGVTDPVPLDFRHALARLKFEGRTEGFAGDVRITGIKVKGATLKGELVVLDPATQPDKAFWELSDAAADKGDMTLLPAHIKDVALTSALQPVIIGGGDMLVLPQAVAGLTVEVSVSQNGTALPMPFTFSLTSTPAWTMNEINTYEITVRPDGAYATVSTKGWTEDEGHTVLDSTHWLELSHKGLDFGCEGGSPEITLQTNYDGPVYGGSQAHPAGIFIDLPGGFPDWLHVANVTGADGSLLRKIRVTADPNTDAGATDRTPAYFTVRAGNLNYKVTVTQGKDSWLTATVEPLYPYIRGLQSLTVNSSYDWTVAIKDGTNEPENGNRRIQSLVTQLGTAGTTAVYFATFDNYAGNGELTAGTVTLVFSDKTGIHSDKEVIVKLTPSIAPRFARSNIVWDAANNRLTFAVTTADNAAIPANVQGVFFKWGSLVAISPVGTWTNPTALGGLILFDPKTTTPGVYTAWNNIPYIDSSYPDPFNNTETSDDDFKGWGDSGLGYKTSEGRGDICRYISQQSGWVGGNWRLPSIREFEVLIGEATNRPNGGAWTNITGAPNTTGANGNPNAYGFYQPVSGRWLGAGMTGKTTDNEQTPSGAVVYFSATGCTSNGAPYGAGTVGYFWSASSRYSTSVHVLYETSGGALTSPNTDFRQGYAFPIRCIRE